MPITFAQVGLGGRERTWLRECERLDWLKLVALCDRDPERMRNDPKWKDEIDRSDVTFYADFQDLLAAEVDFIFLTTPPAVHTEMAIQALEAGKAVLSEIPAVMSLDEGRRLVEVVERTGTAYMLAENFCYRRDIQAFARFIQQGKLGRMVYARCSYCTDNRPSMCLSWAQRGIRGWMLNFEFPRYITHNLGPILYVLQDRVATISVLAPNGRMTMAEDQTTFFSAQCTTERGIIIYLLYGYGINRDDCYYSFTGTDGTIESLPFHVNTRKSNPDLLPDTPYRLTRMQSEQDEQLKHGKLVDLDPGPTFNAYRGGSHYEADLCTVAAFAETIRDGKPSPINVHQALDMTLPGIAAVESIRRGGAPVPVPCL